jgi:2-phospho-L-lactate guanylyltransferase
MKAINDVWAVIPVKNFGQAKQRLAPLLDEAERAELARMMLTDVLAALGNVAEIAGTVVVTADRDAADLAQRLGAGIVDEPAGGGLNLAVQRAAQVLAQAGRQGMLIVPADVPGVLAHDVSAALACLTTTGAVLVPARRDGGTNLLAYAPLDALRPCFGPDSARLHTQAASRAGLAPAVLKLPSLQLDIDRPADLADFMAQLTPTRTREFLLNLPHGRSGPLSGLLRRAAPEPWNRTPSHDDRPVT